MSVCVCVCVCGVCVTERCCNEKLLQQKAKQNGKQKEERGGGGEERNMLLLMLFSLSQSIHFSLFSLNPHIFSSPLFSSVPPSASHHHPSLYLSLISGHSQNSKQQHRHD